MIELIKVEQIEQFDHYMFLEKTQLSTKDVLVTVDFDRNKITGEMVAHGSWYDIDQQQCEKYLSEVKKHERKREFRKMIK